MDPEVSQVTLCICSHLRPVVFGLPSNIPSGADPDPGWWHVGPSGTVENFNSESCQAGIYRFKVDLPEDATSVGNAVPSAMMSNTSDDKTFNERYPDFNA